ncbi:MAG: PAS domain-containing protein [Ignavibacteria bacterium]|nr:PAS domain-containing protein [Ignavibacteria bacterium]
MKNKSVDIKATSKNSLKSRQKPFSAHKKVKNPQYRSKEISGKSSHSAKTELLNSRNKQLITEAKKNRARNKTLQTLNKGLKLANAKLNLTNENVQSENRQLNSINTDLNSLLNSINIPVILLDNKLMLLDFTKASGSLFGLNRSDIGRKFIDIRSNIPLAVIHKHLREVRTKLIPLDVIIKKNTTWFSVKIRPLVNEGNRIVNITISFIDTTSLLKNMAEIETKARVTEMLNAELNRQAKHNNSVFEKNYKRLKTAISSRRKAQNSLKQISKESVNTQEKERLRIARELHDGVNQILALARRKLYSIEEQAKEGKQIILNPELAEAGELISGAISELRNVSHHLRPPGLHHFGLLPAIKFMCEEISRRSKIAINLNILKIKSYIPPEIELHIFRIVQEAFSNAEKHSATKKINMAISERSGGLHIVIEDFGRGYVSNNTAKKLPMLSSGLIGIKERIEAVEGSLKVSSALRKGTKIIITIPIK